MNDFSSHSLVDRASQKPATLKLEELEDLLADYDIVFRHKILLLNYINCRNWKRAFQMTGSKASDISISRMLYQMKKKKDFVSALKVLETWFIANTFIKKEAVLAELAKIGFADIADYLTWTEDSVELKPSELLLKEGIDTSIISEISVSHTKMGKNIKLKLYDRMQALTLIGKHLQMFNDRLEITGAGGGPIQVTHMMKQSIEEIYGDISEIDEQENATDAEARELPLLTPEMASFEAEWEKEEEEAYTLGGEDDSVG